MRWSRSLTAEEQGDGELVIRGEARSVSRAARAAILVLPVAIGGGVRWVVLDAASLEIEPRCARSTRCARSRLCPGERH